ncbi:MAG TPA: universal stress protein [Gemmatimonadales bacterium]|nr:universal stress protein [Gemmatimonadales bacterium]
MRKRPAGPEPLRIRSVLLPLDGSPFAEQALPWAAAIARKAHARLRLALVHQPPQPPPADDSDRRLYTRVELALRKSQRDYLRSVAAQLKGERATRVATATLDGAPAPALGEYVQEIGVDLVVMTTHGRGGLERAWLGSVADQLVRSLEVPVLLIRPTDAARTNGARTDNPRTEGSRTEGSRTEGPEAEPGLEEVLVPLDGSPLAEAALPPALAVASLFGARLTLVQGVEPVVMLVGAPTPFARNVDQELSALRRREAKDYLDDLAERATAQGVPTRGTAVLCSGALEAIQAAARAPGIGMIALATHGRGGLRRLVLGSVADKLVRSSDLPILVTRPRGR